MARKDYHAPRNEKKQKMETKKMKPKTAYQLERDAAKNRKKRGGNYN